MPLRRHSAVAWGQNSHCCSSFSKSWTRRSPLKTTVSVSSVSEVAKDDPAVAASVDGPPRARRPISLAHFAGDGNRRGDVIRAACGIRKAVVARLHVGGARRGASRSAGAHERRRVRRCDVPRPGDGSVIRWTVYSASSRQGFRTMANQLTVTPAGGYPAVFAPQHLAWVLQGLQCVDGMPPDGDGNERAPYRMSSIEQWAGAAAIEFKPLPTGSLSAQEAIALSKTIGKD